MLSNKALAIGIENYKEIIDKNYYYVDKTLLIKELLDKGGKINLFTRPRRFGKTLALSTLRTLFECDANAKGEVADNSHYFEGMKIMERKAEPVAYAKSLESLSWISGWHIKCFLWI